MTLNWKLLKKLRKQNNLKELHEIVRKENQSYEFWNKIINRLNLPYLNLPTKAEAEEIGLNSRKDFFCLYKKSANLKFSVSYSPVYSIIRKLLNKDAQILEIGFGENPRMIKILNKEGYRCFGIEPLCIPDNKIIFKAEYPELPKVLQQKYDCIFGVLVFPKIYEGHKSHEKLKKNKEARIKMLQCLKRNLKPEGYLILMGNMFSNSEFKSASLKVIINKDILLRDYTRKSSKFNTSFELAVVKNK